MTNLSDLDLEEALRNADAAGDKPAASLLAQEWQRRKADPVSSSIAQTATPPEPKGIMEDSGINAFGRSVRENIGGGAGAAVGGAAGAKAGSLAGSFFGPGIGTAVGGGIGALGGGILGAMFGGEAQQAIYPTSDDTHRILEADAAQHPGMSTAGNILPYLATLKPSLGGARSAFTKLTPEMTAAEANSVIGHRFGMGLGAGLGGVSEAVMPMISGRDVEPERVVLGTLLGALFNEPNRLGRAMGLPSMPTLSEVRAGQMAAAVPTPGAPVTETAIVPRSPEINVDAVIGPRAVGFPEVPVAPEGANVRFAPPDMLPGEAAPMALPETTQNGVQASLRREQAVEVQQQVERLKARRDDMVARKVDPKAIKQIEAQLKAREQAMKGLEFDTTIIAPPAPRNGPEIIENNALATPPQERAPLVPEAPVAPARPVDPRMAARDAGTDVIGRGERPAFMAADAIIQAKLADEAVAQSRAGAAGLREQLASSTAAPERVNYITEDYARAQQNAANGGDEWARVQANEEPVAAFRKQDGELKLYDGHHRLVNAQNEGKPTLPVNIDGEGVKSIPLSAFTSENPTNAKTATAPKQPSESLAPLPVDIENRPGKLVTDIPGDSAPSVPMARPDDAPEVAQIRKQLSDLDDDIALAKEDGDTHGARGLEAARARVQDNLNEAMNTQTPKSVADRIRSKKVDVKGKGNMNLPLVGLDEATARRAWNGALEVAAKAVEAGAKLAAGAKAALAYVRQNFPKATFKDAEFTRAVEADVVSGLGAARRAGEKEAAHVAADDMNRNPDKFFRDADSTPVQSYMDDVDKTMRNAGRDVMSGRAAKSVWQHIKDFNRNYLRGNQAALDDLAKGGSETGRKSPALDKLNTEINGTRPGAQGKGERGIWDDTVTRTKARTNELNEAYNAVRATVDNLGSVEKEAFLSNLVRWMQDPNYKSKLRNQPEVLKAVDTLRKVTRDLYTDLKAHGIDVGDGGANYFSRSLDADVVRRNYDDFVNQFTKFYDEQWKQNDPKYVSDPVKARDAAKAYADAAILGHEGIALDGSDLNLGVQRTGDPDFFKARTFTGAVSDAIDKTAAKFYKRNPFETLTYQINRVERRIGLARAFGKVVKDNGKDVLDPTAKWREFTRAARDEGNEKIIPEVLARYQMMFGIGGKVDPRTQAFQQAVRNLGYYAYLPFSGINSMTEPTVLAMRLNKPMSGLFQAYGKSFRSIARQIKNMPLDYKEKAADALGVAENATMRAAMSLGKLDDQGLLTDNNLAKYFFLTGNSIVSNATSNAAVDIGMSALRMSLLDFAHGREATSSRMWLEELGIKKADFDRVSKWLESHANDDERFTKLFDKNEEAGIVRDAIRKFAREARSLPDAGTKNQHSAGTFGSMLLSLQSYLYDFTDKVLGRNARQFMTGIKGKTILDGEVTPTDLTQQERVRMMAPMMLGMPSLIAGNYGIAVVREALYPDPEKIRRDRERSAGEIDWNRFQRALTRSNMMGPYDMLFNMFTQARYERDVAASALGPYMGGVLELAKSAIAQGGERNSGNTNTAERKTARNFWNVGPKPLINMALSTLPAGKMAGVAAAGIQLGSQRSVAEGFVDGVAGRQKADKKKKPKQTP